MSKLDRFEGTAENWETGVLGMNPETAKAADPAHEAMLDEALGLERLVVRMPKDSIQSLRSSASALGLPVQFLVRQALEKLAKELEAQQRV